MTKVSAKKSLKKQKNLRETISGTDGKVYFPFYTKSYVFSNHFHCPGLEYDSQIFDSTEKAYFYAKVRHFNDEEAARRILSSSSLKEAKRIASESSLVDLEKWKRVSEEYMYMVNRAKYKQFSELRRKLLETGEAILVEASPFDRFWGIGLGMSKKVEIADTKKWKGLNKLGKILMQIREELKEVVI